jgi:hypothetical protein
VIISTQSVALANCFEPDDFIVVDYEEGESKFERFGKDTCDPSLAMVFMISDNTTNASGCNPISGSSSTMVAGRKSLG